MAQRVGSEADGGRIGEQAAILARASPGRQVPLWDKLADAADGPELLFVAGARDEKFCDIAHRMLARGADSWCAFARWCWLLKS